MKTHQLDIPKDFSHDTPKCCALCKVCTIFRVTAVTKYKWSTKVMAQKSNLCMHRKTTRLFWQMSPIVSLTGCSIYFCTQDIYLYILNSQVFNWSSSWDLLVLTGLCLHQTVQYPHFCFILQIRTRNSVCIVSTGTCSIFIPPITYLVIWNAACAQTADVMYWYH